MRKFAPAVRYDAVAIVASTRGLGTLRRLLKRLPSTFPVPILCLVQAVPTLAGQLSDETGLQVQWAAPEGLHIVVHRGFDKRALDDFSIVGIDEEIASARALRHRQRIVIEDVDADPQYGPYRNIAAAAGFRAMQSTPILTLEAPIPAVFSTHYEHPHSVGPHEARMLDQIAVEAQPLVVRFVV